MNGVMVLRYAFGTKVFCYQIRQMLLQLKGTYTFFQFFKCRPKILTFLPVNHKVEIVITKRTILNSVTVQKDYKDFRVLLINSEKQCFARKFGQGHKTPAVIKEIARKQKQCEPNMKNKLLCLMSKRKSLNMRRIRCPVLPVIGFYSGFPLHCRTLMRT